MRILIIGSGGREHALAWKLNQSNPKPEIFIAPGNGGTALEGTNVLISDSNIAGIMDFVRKNSIDLVIPGPEMPLVLGLVDACEKAGVPCFGPKAYAAALEGSKAFAKVVMQDAGVPTAPFAVFTSHVDAESYIRAKGAPIVVKADGLAAGKGVVVAKTVEEALEAINDMMVKKIFGPSGETVVIEDLLVGEEASFLAFCQGDTVLPLPAAQDHKAVNDGDTGPNTGGMGAYSPAPVLPESRYSEIIEKVIRPVLAEMEKRGCAYSGILYAGLMMTSEGPKVVEFNCRFGDPECQPLLMRMEGDLLEIMLACAQGKLHEVSLDYKDDTALCVVIAAKGYPRDFPKGMLITGLDEAEATAPGMVKVFQAGTKLDDKGQTVSNGGRVLGVTALGATLAEAQNAAYAATEKIRMENMHFRRDIGSKGLRSCWACSGGTKNG